MLLKEVAVQLMEHLCNHDWHGYSQVSRWGDGEGTCPVEIGGKTYYLEQGDRDCSSAIISAFEAAGISCGGATYTGNMRSCMVGTGNFRWHPMSEGYIAKRGDVYLNEMSHTAMCTSAVPDMLAEFSISETGGTDGAEGDQTGSESSIHNYYNFPWDGILECICAATDGNAGKKSASVQLWTPNNTFAQRWIPHKNSDGTYSLECASCRLYLDIMNGGTASPTPVWVYEKNGSDAQKWIVQQIPDPTGYYDPEFVRPAELIPVINKNLRLDCVDGGNVNGTVIQVHAANNTSAQHWAVVDTGVGSWVLINVVSSKALDVKNGG